MEKLMTSCCPASRNLLRYLDKWKKSPQLDIDLGYELECFLVQFEQKQNDRNNFNASDFAEVAIFVQNYAAIYDKKVDLLLKSLLVLHKELCDISSKPVENEEAQPGEALGEVPPCPPPTEQPIEEKVDETKNKRKKKEKETPKEGENPEPQPSTSTALTGAELNALTEEIKAKESFSENEMKEIGELWKMLNKIEKHKIENILNNLDENEGIEELWEKLESKKKQLEDTVKNGSNSIVINDSGIYSNPGNMDLDDSHVFEDSICEENDPNANQENDNFDLLLNEENLEEVLQSIENGNEPTVNQEHQDDSTGTKNVDHDKENLINAKVEALKEVRIRLKRLTHDEIMEQSESYCKKFKKAQTKEEACLNCTGCTALKHICSLNGVESEAQKKEKDMKVPERRSIRKRAIEEETKVLKVSMKKIKLELNRLRVVAQENDFEHFYDQCYKNLKWIGKKLTCDMESFKKLPEPDTCTREDAEEDSIFDINDNDINEKGCNDETNVSVNKNDIQACHEVLNSLIDEVSKLDKNSEEINIRFSQESGFSEDYFDLDSLNQTQIDKELENFQNKDILGLEQSDPSSTNLNESCNTMLSPSYFFPHTPAHSEDSGRFSSAACHSDIEGENLNRSIHHDSGVEMSHHSEDEDDNNSDIMPTTFKSLDPNTLSFYKKKCESLLEQRERDQKVRDWQKFLKDKEAKRVKLPEFHIDEYETRILDSLPDDSTKSVPFNEVVEGKSAEEVARYFAATLQLANMSNVAISDNSLAADGADVSFKLTLQSREKYYEDIEFSDSFMENLSKKPFLTSTPFKAPKPKFKKFKY